MIYMYYYSNLNKNITKFCIIEILYNLICHRYINSLIPYTKFPFRKISFLPSFFLLFFILLFEKQIPKLLYPEVQKSLKLLHFYRSVLCKGWAKAKCFTPIKILSHIKTVSSGTVKTTNTRQGERIFSFYFVLIFSILFTIKYVSRNTFINSKIST